MLVRTTHQLSKLRNLNNVPLKASYFLSGALWMPLVDSWDYSMISLGHERGLDSPPHISRNALVEIPIKMDTNLVSFMSLGRMELELMVSP